MPATRCLKCKFPLTHDESRAGTCPFCGEVLDITVPPEPPPAETSPSPAATAPARIAGRSRKTPWAVWAVAAGVLIVFGGVWAYYLKAPVALLLRNLTQTRPGAAAAGAQAAPQSAGEARPGDTAVARADGPPTGSSPTSTTDPQASGEARPGESKSRRGDPAVAHASSQPAAAQAKPRPVAPEAAPEPDTPAGNETRIDKPNDEYFVDSVNGGAQIKLVGRAKRLRVGSVNGGSTLDASELRVQEAVFTGAINGGSTVKLSAPDGRVEFLGGVNGRSTLVVNAPNGRVVFGAPEGAGAGGAEIGGESQVTITAMQVSLRAPISGTATRVLVTLTRSGRLRFREISGASRLHYRKSDPGDPEPVIEAGVVKASAQVKRVE